MGVVPGKRGFACEACPNHALCVGGTALPVALDGFWADPQYAETWVYMWYTSRYRNVFGPIVLGRIVLHICFRCCYAPMF